MISVHEAHEWTVMRMNNDVISRSEAIKALDQHSYETGYDYDTTVEILKELLALDVTPVVHAKWVKAHGMMPPEYFGRHVCSSCDQFALNDKVGREKLSDWCPHCGAKMDGE